MSGKVKNLVGRVFDDLEVISFNQIKDGVAHWDCKCLCGALCIRRRDYLSRKNFKSCGCKDSKGDKWDTKRREYTVYHSMRGRCSATDETTKMYKNYSSKGITVCDRWLESFSNFFEDMGECPEGYTLERVDNILGYSKDNCVWECKEIQDRNKNKPSGCTSSYRGVSYVKSDQVFRAYVKLQGRQVGLGRYKTEKEAAVVRDKYILGNQELCIAMGRKRLENYLNFPEKFKEELCQYFTTQC